MGSGASTEEVKGAISGKSPEEIAAALRELPADQLAKIKDACNKGGPCPGPVDCSAITVVAKDYKGLLEQPKEPKFKGALCQIFVRGQPYGGSDKSNSEVQLQTDFRQPFVKSHQDPSGQPVSQSGPC